MPLAVIGQVLGVIALLVGLYLLLSLGAFLVVGGFVLLGLCTALEVGHARQPKKPTTNDPAGN